MSARRLRVGLDGRAFVSPAAGVRRYIGELARTLAAEDFGVDLVAIGAPAEEPLPQGVQRAAEGRSAPTNFGRHVTGLPLAIQRARVDLYHAPAYTAPQWGSTPVVLSVHDVSYARHPEWYPYRRDPLRRWFYRHSARRARLILTISEFSKREIVAAYGIPEGRIVVTPLGVSEMFRPAQNGLEPLAEGAARQAAGAPRPRDVAAGPPFLLHVGDLHARRNVGIVVRALARLRAQARQPAQASGGPALASVRLVLVGVDRGVGDALLEEATRLNVRDAIDLRGRVSDAELVALYQQCAALVYPSRYEGFGFPLVEAMACGAPVIASNRSAIPEVTGSAAVLLDPDDEQGFAAAIARVLSDDEFAASCRARGLARAAQFTWQATAVRTADAYRRVASIYQRSW
jgi:glycosyltransferase involved in cell wall biosynthesis